MATFKLNTQNQYFESKLPIIVRHSIVHFRQRFDWDCGISCVLMMLTRQQRQDFLRNFNKICENEEFGTSTWSIDLCYLLKKFGIQHIFTTITMGVNPDFRNHDYYGPILWRDHVRVSEKFASAEKNGLTVQRKTVDIAQILRHLAFKGPIIALTNGQLLHCTLCQSKNALLKCFERRPKPGFNGHYIVVCGYDNRIESIFYRNPALDDHLCSMSYKKFNEARSNEGTDDDLIFIYQTDK